ncbi:hypothetical protein K469DRAFT_723149 [Zopfia rhizophila CBS 207.26]|uniref:Heterokaryon incompatibility domain-containing protein n=1 Tax=Zopfia rhizophila CBS 207.26 TaxID=1314779 RepID=A0A6A6EKC2_9PEZI|nr:hypothetical protein K469DRAFT_723149 [Zopfia rhizophila CBS 207.26]
MRETDTTHTYCINLPQNIGPTLVKTSRLASRSCPKRKILHVSHQFAHGFIGLPTKLLYVRTPDAPDYDPDVLCLDTALENEGKYIALSHYWGKLPVEDKKQFCTTHDNIGQRQRGFSISVLPKTFWDAIKATRELRERECGRMGEVFLVIYCIIAATSAVDSNAGFLDRNVSSEYVYVQDTLGRRFYVCTDIDNFDNDAEKARLNTRGWVMQERELSGRIIYFSANQTYFGCKSPTISDSLKYSQPRHFAPQPLSNVLYAPNFPDRPLASGAHHSMEFIHFLSEDYSDHGFSMQTRRCVAISGLGARIARALWCQSRYGIFQRYLHRYFLWKASHRKMGQMFDWNSSLRFDEECKLALIAEVEKVRDCTIQLDREHYAVLDSGGIKRGWIQYDIERGRDLLQRTIPAGGDGKHRKVGIGLIESDNVVRQRRNVRLV